MAFKKGLCYTTAMASVSVRKATMQDFSSVQQLYYGLFLHEFARDPLIHSSWPLETPGEHFLKNIITGINTICFVAEHKQVAVGFLIGSMLVNDPIRPCNRSQLISIFVEEMYRNQTVGSMLIDEFVRWSKQKRAERISVIVQHDNTKGLSFYKRLGFSNHLFVLEKNLIE